MPKALRLYQVDAFTDRPFTGNPAGVAPEAEGLTPAQMQAIARELNNSETAFILPAEGPDHDVRVRFFTPTTEVPICGHATIAAHFVRALEGAGDGATRQLTGAGVLAVETEGTATGRPVIWMTQRPAVFEPALAADRRTRLLAALGMTDADLADFGEVQVVSTGHSKVLVPLRSRATLETLRPDLGALAALSAEIGCNGYYPFTLDAPSPGTRASGRMFAPAIGIAEDPVTGNAAGPLGAFLLRHGLVHAGPGGVARLVAGQGEAIGRPGRVVVEAKRETPRGPIGVRIAGQATAVFRAELRL